METNDMNELETLRVRPLSNEEVSRAWKGIVSRLPLTATLSPFAFPVRKAISLVAVFIFIVGTVTASDSAHTGQILFPVDLAVEQIEASIDPSSRADHARERFVEFDQIVGDTLTQDAAPASARMGKSAAPEADMMMFSVTNDGAPSTPLSEETQQAIATTRTELEQILNDAMLKEHTETIMRIMSTIDEFDERVRMMHGQ